MTCPDKIPSYAEFQALLRRIEKLEQCCQDKDKEDPNFAQKVFAALRGQKSKFDGLVSSANVGGVVLAGSAATYTAAQMSKVVNVTAEILPFAEDLPALRKLPGEFNAIKRNTAQEFTTIRRTTVTNQTAIKEVNKALPDLSQIKRTANNALATANKASGTANGAATTANKALSVGTSAGKTAATAAGTAAAAGATASSALSKITSFLSAIGVIGGVAGLISLFGFFKATRPQLNANDSRLDSLSKAISQNLSRITQNRAIAKRAESAAAEAQQSAAIAKKTADGAKVEASQAKDTATVAKSKAEQALKQSAAANSTANQALKEVRDLSFPDVKVLKQQNATAIKQNSRITSLIEGLEIPTQGDLSIPPELLAVRGLISSQSSKLNQIGRDASAAARNTTQSKLKKAAGAAVCEASRPSGCVDQAVSRNTKPLRSLLNKILGKLEGVNFGLNATILNNVNQSIRKLDKLTTAVNQKFDKTWKFLKMDRVLNLISTAASIHNAAMLSRNLAESLVFAVDGIFAMVGLKDAEGEPFSFSEQISGGIRAIINRTIGAEAARGISQRWNSWNRIISAGAAVVMSVRSVQWAIAEGVEIIGDWIAKIGNGLREGGTVDDRQWPWMKEGIKIKQFSAVERFNDGLESAETITNQVYATVSAGAEIGEAVNGVRASKQQFDQTLETENQEADDQLTQDNADSEAPDIEPIDLVKIEEVEE